MRIPAIIVVTIGLILIPAGCKKKENNSVPPKSQSQSSSQVSKKSQQPVMKISDNPGFFTATAIKPQATEAKDLDKLLRPILTRLFEDAKLIEESKAPVTQRDGEVIENRLVYAVRMILTPQEGDNLHSALKQAGFVSSVRLGSKPTHFKSAVAMSVMKTTSLRGYSLVINVDSGEQKIEIESYKLGSKYDRMM